MIKGIYSFEYFKLNDEIPTIVIKNNKLDLKKRPAVILMHGLFGSKERNLIFALKLADKGFLVAMIDARLHGDRSEGSLIEKMRKKPLETMVSILTDTVDDFFALIDYLQSREDVIVDKIGMTGISLGGLFTFIVGLNDDRVRVLAPIIASGDFFTVFTKTTLLDELGSNKEKFGDLELPDSIKGLLEHFDPIYHPEKLYPRPLLMITGEKDDIFPKEAVMNTVDSLKRAYSENPSLFVYSEYKNIGHEVTEEMVDEVISFLEEHLS